MKHFIVSCLSILSLASTQSMVIAQITPSVRTNQGVGSSLNYPSGTRIYTNGSINTPNGRVIYPSVTIKNGNGSNTYYYSNGTRITTNKNTVNPSGTFLIPGINGGLYNRVRINPIENGNL